MKKEGSPNKKTSALRKQAEKILASKQAKTPKIRAGNPQALIHELQVHQIELEMQNEELRASQLIIENSRRRFSDLYDCAPVGYLTIDKGGKLIEANLTASELLGYGRRNMIGKPLTFFVNRDDQDVLYLHFRRLREGHFHSCEVRLIRKSGDLFFAQLTSVPFATEGQSDQNILMAISNISLRKAAEETHSRLASIVEGTDDAIVSNTLGGTIVSWNGAAEKIYGYAANEVVGKPFSILAPPDSPGEIPRLLSKIEAGELVKNFETFHKRKDGSMIPVSLTVSPVRTEDGKIVGVSTITRDITERRKWEESILDLNRRLQVSNRELETLAHILAHDLRAPIIGIEGFTRILSEDHSANLDEKGKHYLQRVIDSAHRMDKMVAGLLMISKISRTEITREKVDLSNLVRTIAGELKTGELESGAEFSIQEGIIVEGDASLLRVAVENLLRNAWKFTGKQRHAVIEFGSAESQGKKALFIRDNGAGFDMKYAGKMFIIFGRLHSQTDFEGTGIGLAIAQRIILRHGGEIWAEGVVDKGATFYFTLHNSLTDSKSLQH